MAVTWPTMPCSAWGLPSLSSGMKHATPYVPGSKCTVAVTDWPGSTLFGPPTNCTPDSALRSVVDAAALNAANETEPNFAERDLVTDLARVRASVTSTQPVGIVARKRVRVVLGVDRDVRPRLRGAVVAVSPPDEPDLLLLPQAASDSNATTHDYRPPSPHFRPLRQNDWAKQRSATVAERVVAVQAGEHAARLLRPRQRVGRRRCAASAARSRPRRRGTPPTHRDSPSRTRSRRSGRCAPTRSGACACDACGRRSTPRSLRAARSPRTSASLSSGFTPK